MNAALDYLLCFDPSHLETLLGTINIPQGGQQMCVNRLQGFRKICAYGEGVCEMN